MVHKVKHISKKTEAFLHHAFIPGEHNDHKPRALHRKHLIRYGIALIVLKGIVVSLLFVFPSSGFFSEMSSRVIFDAVNRERENFSVPILDFNATLYGVARDKANDMIQNDYFAHTSPQGATPCWPEWCRRAAGNNARD